MQSLIQSAFNQQKPMARRATSRRDFAWWKWLVFGCLVVVASVVVLPTVLGSRWIYEPLLKRLEAGNFRLTVESVQLRWFSPLVLRGIAVDEQAGPRLLNIREVHTDRGLLGSLLSGRRIGRLTIIDPQLEIELMTDESNLTRLADSLSGKLGSGTDADHTESRPPAIDIDVDVQGLAVRVQQVDHDRPLVAVPPIDISMSYRAVDGNSSLHVEPARLLDEVEVTPELMQLGLGYAIPLLAKSAWFNGRISLETGAIDIPLGEPKQSIGSATITLHELRSGPSEPATIQILDMIAQLRGRQPQHELVFVDGSKIEIDVRDQLVSHRGLKAGLPKVDPRLQLSSQGSVGLGDRSLDLVVDVPVPIELLARRDEVRELGVPSMGLPIRGTLDDPKVDWSAMRGEGADLLGLIREKIANESPGTAAILGGLEGLAEGQADQAIGAAIDLLQEIRKVRQAKKRTNTGEPDVLPDSAEPPKPTSDRPILDALRKAIRGSDPEE